MPTDPRPKTIEPSTNPFDCICPTHHEGYFKFCPVHLQWPWTEPVPWKPAAANPPEDGNAR